MKYADIPVEITAGEFTNTWESLKQYQCPEWFRDAKFGVWAHWGPQSVPMYGDWYARSMYEEGSACYRYHLEHYGHPSEFGYKDIIELWKAEHFDPEYLMGLYHKMGARFFVSMGVHHDNFDLWDSRYHSWNAVKHGPKRDIVGEWKRAAEKYGLRFGVSEHLERSFSWFATNKGADKEGKWAGVPYDGNDPAFRELYLDNSLADCSCAYPLKPDPVFVRNFYLRIKDLVERYDPDWLYTDGGIPFEEVGRAMAANFYNHNMARHNGKLEAVYCAKDINHLYPELYHGEYVEGTCLLDLERTLSGEIRKEPWQTDTCIGNWFYDTACTYRTAETVLQQLVDVVSKNGTFLLSIPLRPDGTIDKKEEQIIADITAWMSVNGEAIYDTRPYEHYGEGPLADAADAAKGKLIQELACTERDFRFTKKGRVLYAVCLKAPQTPQILLRSLDRIRGRVEAVSVLGDASCAEWHWEEGGLSVRYHLPEGKVPLHTVKIVLKNEI